MNPLLSQRILQLLLAVLLLCPMAKAAATNFVDQVAALIDPAKLATLRERGANPRVQKYVFLLAAVQTNGQSPTMVASNAVYSVGMRGAAATLTTDAMVRNLEIATKLGCLNPAGLEDMRRGQSPTIQTGPYKGQELSVDHIIPLAVCPELDRVVANLELLPLRVNSQKNAAIGDRQRDLAKRLHEAGLLSETGLAQVREK